MTSEEVAKSAPKASNLPACGFSVHGGKNGNAPVKVEKRPKGKKVTIISNVQGSAKSLLSALSSLLGTGGTMKQETSGIHWTVEIQGDQVERVGAALRQFGCLKGVKKDVEPKKKEPDVAETTRGYDKFLRQGDGSTAKSDAKHARSEAAKSLAIRALEIGPCALPGADCTKWHGPSWIYCRGQCVQTDMNDIWEDTLLGDDCLPVPKDLPAPFASVAELNISLRELGMLSEGNVVRQPRRAAPAQIGMFTADENRQKATMPGARFICDEKPGEGIRARGGRASSRAASTRRTGDDIAKAAPSRRSHSCGPSKPFKSRPTDTPGNAKLGQYPCRICGHQFELQKTMKLHMRNAHPGMQVPKSSTGPGMQGPRYAFAARPPGGGVAQYSQGAVPYLPKKAATRDHSALLLPAGSWLDRHQQRKEKVQQALSKESAGSKGGTIACPVCGDAFAASCIDSHVDLCLQAHDVSSGSTSEDERVAFTKPAMQSTMPGMPRSEAQDWKHSIVKSSVEPVCEGREKPDESDEDDLAAEAQDSKHGIVKSSFEPEGEGKENQLQIFAGDGVVLTWQQPKSEKAYWAYGHRDADPSVCGYFPLKHVSIDTRRSAASSGKAVGKAADKTADKATDKAAKTRGPSGVGQEGPEGSEGEPAGGFIGGAQPVPEEWLDIFLELQLPDARAQRFWQSFEQHRRNMPLQDAWLRAIEEQFAVPSGPEHQHFQDCQRLPSRDRSAEHTKMPVGYADRSAEHTKMPVGYADSIEICSLVTSRSAVGTRARHGGVEVCKRPSQHRDSEQSSEKQKVTFEEHFGGVTAVDASVATAVDALVASPCALPEGQGDLYDVAAIHSPSGEGSDVQLQVRPGDVVHASWVQPESEGGYWAYGSIVSSGSDAPGYVPLSCLTKAKEVTGLMAPLSKAEQPGPKKSWQRRKEKVAAPARGTRAIAQTSPAVTAKAPATTLEVVSDEEAAGEEIYQKALDEEVILLHSPAQAGSGACSATAEELQEWAEARLAALARQFCFSHVDASCAFSSLSICMSADETRGEAIALIADNKPVRNFAAELWRRKAAAA